MITITLGGAAALRVIPHHVGHLQPVKQLLETGLAKLQGENPPQPSLQFPQFSPQVGSQCVKFVGCDHVYCRDCMSGYLNVR